MPALLPGPTMKAIPALDAEVIPGSGVLLSSVSSRVASMATSMAFPSVAPTPLSIVPVPPTMPSSLAPTVKPTDVLDTIESSTGLSLIDTMTSLTHSTTDAATGLTTATSTSVQGALPSADAPTSVWEVDGDDIGTKIIIYGLVAFFFGVFFIAIVLDMVRRPKETKDSFGSMGRFFRDFPKALGRGLLDAMNWCFRRRPENSGPDPEVATERQINQAAIIDRLAARIQDPDEKAPSTTDYSSNTLAIDQVNRRVEPQDITEAEYIEDTNGPAEEGPGIDITTTEGQPEDFIATTGREPEVPVTPSGIEPGSPIASSGIEPEGSVAQAEMEPERPFVLTEKDPRRFGAPVEVDGESPMTWQRRNSLALSEREPRRSFVFSQMEPRPSSVRDEMVPRRPFAFVERDPRRSIDRSSITIPRRPVSRGASIISAAGSVASTNVAPFQQRSAGGFPVEAGMEAIPAGSARPSSSRYSVASFGRDDEEQRKPGSEAIWEEEGSENENTRKMDEWGEHLIATVRSPP